MAGHETAGRETNSGACRRGGSGAHSSLPSPRLETKVPAFLYLGAGAGREAAEFAEILRKKFTTITLPV